MTKPSVTIFQQGNFTVAVVEATIEGELKRSVGFAKYNPADSKLFTINARGKKIKAHPFKKQLGQVIATGRAMKNFKSGVYADHSWYYLTEEAEMAAEATAKTTAEGAATKEKKFVVLS